MQNVIFIHGAYGNGKENWFPWLKKELENLDCRIYVPKFPTPEDQSLKNWLKVFEKYEKYLDDNCIFVAHSLGPAFLMNIFEKTNKKIRVAFFVSGFTGLLNNPTFDGINRTFVDKEFDWSKIKENCKRFYIFHSDNDPYVPLEKAKQLAKNLDTEVIIVRGGGHFNEKSGYLKFDLLLEDIKIELGWYKGKKFKIVRHSAGGIVVNRKSQVCLIKNKDFDYLDNWFIPKGGIENNETSFEAAKREIWEETGVKELKLIKKLGVVKRPNIVVSEEFKIIDIFLFKTSEDKLNPQEDITEAKWFDINEVIDKLYIRQEKEFFKDNINEIKSIVI